MLSLDIDVADDKKTHESPVLLANIQCRRQLRHNNAIVAVHAIYSGQHLEHHSTQQTTRPNSQQRRISICNGKREYVYAQSTTVCVCVFYSRLLLIAFVGKIRNRTATAMRKPLPFLPQLKTAKGSLSAWESRAFGLFSSVFVVVFVILKTTLQPNVQRNCQTHCQTLTGYKHISRCVCFSFSVLSAPVGRFSRSRNLRTNARACNGAWCYCLNDIKMHWGYRRNFRRRRQQTPMTATTETLKSKGAN